jgi:hypothetical protein
MIIEIDTKFGRINVEAETIGPYLAVHGRLEMVQFVGHYFDDVCYSISHIPTGRHLCSHYGGKEAAIRVARRLYAIFDDLLNIDNFKHDNCPPLLKSAIQKARNTNKEITYAELIAIEKESQTWRANKE